MPQNLRVECTNCGDVFWCDSGDVSFRTKRHKRKHCPGAHLDIQDMGGSGVGYHGGGSSGWSFQGSFTPKSGLSGQVIY